jgi:hypothetical protein
MMNFFGIKSIRRSPRKMSPPRKSPPRKVLFKPKSSGQIPLHVFVASYSKAGRTGYLEHSEKFRTFFGDVIAANPDVDVNFHTYNLEDASDSKLRDRDLKSIPFALAVVFADTLDEGMKIEKTIRDKAMVSWIPVILIVSEDHISLGSSRFQGGYGEPRYNELFMMSLTDKQLLAKIELKVRECAEIAAGLRRAA